MKRAIINLSLAALLIVIGCKKDSDPVITRTDLLTKNNGWIITSATINPGIVIGSTSYTDFYSLLDACQKDDRMVFNAAGTYKEENPLKCDNSELSILESGTWAFNSIETVITFNPSGKTPYEYSVLNLNSTTLKISSQFTIGTSSTVYTLTGTYTAQ